MMNNTILAFTCVIKIHFLDTQPLICFCLSRRACMFCFRFAHVRHTCQWPVLVWGSACVQIRKCRQLCLHVSPVPCVISVCVRSEGKFKERRMCACVCVASFLYTDNGEVCHRLSHQWKMNFLFTYKHQEVPIWWSVCIRSECWERGYVPNGIRLFTEYCAEYTVWTAKIMS